MALESETGRVVGGRYRLIEKLGAGGFGKVWSARDEMLAIDVAIKEVWLPPAMSEAEQTERLARAEREARNAARLRDHPHIIAVHDVVLDDGPWIVMRLVVGRSLQDRIDRDGRLPVDEASRVAAGILSALSAAHAAGIVHRDVKPANVMLTNDGGVLLGDFGIAVHHADTALTATGGFIGSVEYIAPERARGTDGLAASDLFSLGTTLYEAVEGFSPFHRDTPTGVLTAVLFEPPPEPRYAGSLTPLLAALLAKEPDSRPTADQALSLLGTGVADAAKTASLQTFPLGPPRLGTPGAPDTLTAPGVPGAPGAPGAPASSPPKKPRSRSGILAAAGAAVLLIGGVAWWAASQSGSDGSTNTGAITGTSTGGSTGGSTSGSSDGNTGSTGKPSSSVPSEDQLKSALVTADDIGNGYAKPRTMAFGIGMYQYQTNGGCAPMEALAKNFDSDRDLALPRVAVALDAPKDDKGFSPGFLVDGVEYHGTDEAKTLMTLFHNMTDQCQKPFTATDSGSTKPQVIAPVAAPCTGNDVDCVAYTFTPAGQAANGMYVITRVGGTLSVLSSWYDPAPGAPITPAMVKAAADKVRAANIPG